MLESSIFILISQTAGNTVTTPTAIRTTAVPTFLAQDTFQRADQQFWGKASDGQTWEQDAAALAALRTGDLAPVDLDRQVI